MNQLTICSLNYNFLLFIMFLFFDFYDKGSCQPREDSDCDP